VNCMEEVKTEISAGHKYQCLLKYYGEVCVV
jgi:hypothetical protein